MPPKKIKRFGPLFYTVLVVALIILAGFYLNQFWNARTQRLANLQNLQSFESSDPNVRLNALGELHKNGVDCSSKLIQLFDHEDSGLRRLGVQGLRSEPAFPESAESVLPLLFDRLRDTDHVVAYHAGEALRDYSKRGRTDKVSQETIQFLFSKLSDETSDAAHALTLLKSIGQTTPSVAEMLKSAMSESDPVSDNEGPKTEGSPALSR